MAKITFISAVAAALLMTAGVAQAGNVAAGKACHGVDGVKGLDETYPILAGQHADYLERALADYKSGKRKNAIMAGMAAALSKEDIADLSAYYASLPGPLKSSKRR
ncbi:MAG: c-type cytochrome [Burkholderiaceae bacterium]